MNTKASGSHRGRPFRGTEKARNEALLEAATRVFMRDGYSYASIDSVSSEAGVSTRTIYERFKNKENLLRAVIERRLDRATPLQITASLDSRSPEEGLLSIAADVAGRLMDPGTASMLRIVITEFARFPELASRMRELDKLCYDKPVAEYLRRQVERRSLSMSDPDDCASMFIQMVIGELIESLLLGGANPFAGFDVQPHIARVVRIFLHGTLTRK